MVLFVGLGNPGPRYEGNRHNIGFMAVDAMAERHRFPPWRRRFQGEATEGHVAGIKVTLLKPMTYMNESGQSVGEAMRWLKLQPDEVVVFHDELDLAPGKLRTKTGGGAAGHNGLRSITSHIGADFRRVRLGIGHPGVKELVHAHVLSDFAKEERKAWLEPMLEAVSDAAGLLAKGDDPGFMNKVASKTKPAKDKPQKEPSAPEFTPTPPRASVGPSEPAPNPFAEALRKLTGGRRD
ncbi:aminoacyl-tRNA hydrolase [Lutibaculum baratangense]|uniref:Peptidyl-tRNA hydrolase n=1 Tax=Lutibaculum baratangense AMV1 TaxID=631454 RepID=V4T9H9_9HYPH|nr:aminoacyl-tRNA hydrolase [Lutibaculum baratangense]ESR23178.1 Peptidyl-tRNA hydrolase [Lutibaculum baratangense AMV1]